MVRKLAEKLRDRNQNFPRDHDQHLGDILTHVNPAKSLEVNSFLRDLYGGLMPRLQPEIDLILRKGDDIRAIEVKCFHLRGGNCLNKSYYDGIDQTLALLMYGFDKAALWHVFDESIGVQQFATSGSTAQLFVREQLKLPIDYTALYVKRNRRDLQFIPTQPRVTDFSSMELVDFKELTTIEDPRLRFTWRSSNTITDFPRVRNLRRILINWLDQRDQ